MSIVDFLFVQFFVSGFVRILREILCLWLLAATLRRFLLLIFWENHVIIIRIINLEKVKGCYKDEKKEYKKPRPTNSG